MKWPEIPLPAVRFGTPSWAETRSPPFRPPSVPSSSGLAVVEAEVHADEYAQLQFIRPGKPTDNTYV